VREGGIAIAIVFYLFRMKYLGRVDGMAPSVRLVKGEILTGRTRGMVCSGSDFLYDVWW